MSKNVKILLPEIQHNLVWTFSLNFIPLPVAVLFYTVPPFVSVQFKATAGSCRFFFQWKSATGRLLLFFWVFLKFTVMSTVWIMFSSRLAWLHKKIILSTCRQYAHFSPSQMRPTMVVSPANFRSLAVELADVQSLVQRGEDTGLVRSSADCPFTRWDLPRLRKWHCLTHITEQ